MHSTTYTFESIPIEKPNLAIAISAGNIVSLLAMKRKEENKTHTLCIPNEIIRYCSANIDKDSSYNFVWVRLAMLGFKIPSVKISFNRMQDDQDNKKLGINLKVSKLHPFRLCMKMMITRIRSLLCGFRLFCK